MTYTKMHMIEHELETTKSKLVAAERSRDAARAVAGEAATKLSKLIEDIEECFSQPDAGVRIRALLAEAKQ